MSTQDFAVVSWSSPRQNVASTDGMSSADILLGVNPGDRHRADAVRNVYPSPDEDDKIFEIVELICHKVTAGIGPGRSQVVGPDRKIAHETLDDDGVLEPDTRESRVLDHIIELIGDS